MWHWLSLLKGYISSEKVYVTHCIVFAVVVKYIELQITFKNNFKNFNLLLCNYFTSFIWSMFPWFYFIWFDPFTFLYKKKAKWFHNSKRECLELHDIFSKGTFTNYIHKILLIIDHLPTWHLWRNSFTGIRKSLHLLTYLVMST